MGVVIFVFTGCLRGGDSSLFDSATTGSSLGFDGASRAVNIANNLIQVEWSLGTSSDISGYKVFTVSSGSLVELSTQDASTNKFIHSGLTTGSLYSYVVQATSAVGITDGNGNVVQALAFGGINGSTVTGQTSANLFFSAVPSATQIRIYCATAGGSDFTLMGVAAVTNTFFSLSGLITNQSYSCKVKAVLPDGSEDQNTLMSNFTPRDLNTGAQFGFAGVTSATNINGTSINVTWPIASPLPGTIVTEYHVMAIFSDDSVQSYVVNAPATSYSITNLGSGEEFNIVVRAADANHLTDGNVKSLQVFTYAGISSATALSATSVRLDFPAAPLASSLRIYCYPSGGPISSIPTMSIASDLTSQILSGFSSGTLYTCVVKAVGQTGEDSNSATASFTTP
jgi:hypothetical protein